MAGWSAISSSSRDHDDPTDVGKPKRRLALGGATGPESLGFRGIACLVQELPPPHATSRPGENDAINIPERAGSAMCPSSMCRTGLLMFSGPNVSELRDFLKCMSTTAWTSGGIWTPSESMQSQLGCCLRRNMGVGALGLSAPSSPSLFSPLRLIP